MKEDTVLQTLNWLLGKNALNDFGTTLRHIITAIEISLSTKSSDEVLKFFKTLYPGLGSLATNKAKEESILQHAYSKLYFMTIELKLSNEQKESLLRCFGDAKKSTHYINKKDPSEFTFYFYESDLLLWDIRNNNLGLFLIMWEVEKISFEKFVENTITGFKQYSNEDFTEI